MNIRYYFSKAFWLETPIVAYVAINLAAIFMIMCMLAAGLEFKARAYAWAIEFSISAILVAATILYVLKLLRKIGQV